MLTRYVVLPSAHAAVAVTLWIAATHAQAAWEHATRLVIRAPVKRCGKSRLLDIVEGTCPRGADHRQHLSPAALVRTIGTDDPPTLLVDEADTIFGREEAPTTTRTCAASSTPGTSATGPTSAGTRAPASLEPCPTFAMAALAGIGACPTPSRTAPSSSPCAAAPRARRSRRSGAAGTGPRCHLGDQLARGSRHAPRPSSATRDPTCRWRTGPPTTGNRWSPSPTWRVASGRGWPGTPAVALTAEAAGDAEGSMSERLLADLRVVFGEKRAMWTADIIERLAQLDEAPWADCYGQPDHRPGRREATAPLRHPLPGGSRRRRHPQGVPAGGPNRRVAPIRHRPPQQAQQAQHCRSGRCGPLRMLRSRGASATERNALTRDVADVADVADTPPGRRSTPRRCSSTNPTTRGGLRGDPPAGWHGGARHPRDRSGRPGRRHALAPDHRRRAGRARPAVGWRPAALGDRGIPPARPTPRRTRP